MDGTLVKHQDSLVPELCHMLICVARQLYSWSLTTQCGELHNFALLVVIYKLLSDNFRQPFVEGQVEHTFKETKKCRVLRKTTEIIEIKRLVSNLLWHHNTKAGNF